MSKSYRRPKNGLTNCLLSAGKKPAGYLCTQKPFSGLEMFVIDTGDGIFCQDGSRYFLAWAEKDHPRLKNCPLG
jgi:hypothetical protein